MRKKIFIFAAVMLAVVVFAVHSRLVLATERKKKDALYRQVELFSDALAIIQTDYVNEVEPKDLIYGALRGMLSSLDPHSQFMDPDTYNELKVDTEGKFGGIGIEITLKDGLLTVVSPIEDTPAWKAGLKPGDRIVRINGEITRDINLTDAVKKLRGKPGEAVNISIIRESEKKLLDFKVVREIIKIRDIKDARILTDDVAYIRLTEFRENTPQDMHVALEKLKKEGAGAFILDLRNNPGGLLDIAVKVAEKFLEKGKIIVTTKSRQAKQDLGFISQENRPITDLPLAVLINEGSASGSEIVAGALQDYKRAVIVGKKSFGKGSVQTVFPLSDGSALRLTTSRYLTPSGKEIHGKGVVPDIEVDEATLTPEPSQAKEEDIFDQLEEKQPPKEESLKDYKSDAQLMRALDVLKAVKIYQKRARQDEKN
jgi:carboxyl-terminal processing protease